MRVDGRFAGTIHDGLLARGAGDVALGVQPVLKPGVVNGAAGARIVDFARGVANEIFQRRRGTGAEVGAGDADVGVDVSDGLCLQLGAIRFDPFGRADQTRLFAVPFADDDRAARLPASTSKFAERASRFEHRGCAAAGIGGAENPRVVMIAEHHPFVVGCAAQFGDHVVDRPLLIVHHELHVNFGVARAEVIRERQTALPVRGNGCAAEIAENHSGILCVDRHGGNVRKIRGVGGREALGGCRGGDAGRERIAGINLRVNNRAALDAAHRTPRTVRECVALRVAVVLGIGINNQRGGFVFVGELRFDAAITSAIARDDDFAFDVHAGGSKRAVIVLHAVVHIDDGRGDFSGRRVSD